MFATLPVSIKPNWKKPSRSWQYSSADLGITQLNQIHLTGLFLYADL
jgi:hypothetical protein